MSKRYKRRHPAGWTFTQHGSSGNLDADLTQHPCDYRDGFICGFCNGSDERKRGCERYYNLMNLNESDWEQAKNDDAAEAFIRNKRVEYDHYPDVDIPSGYNFLMHGDEPGSAARGQVVDEIDPASAFDTQVGEEQTMPTKNALPYVWSLVIRDMVDRDIVGVKRYGTRLQPNNGRDSLRDALDEALDLACYLRQVIYERDGK